MDSSSKARSPVERSTQQPVRRSMFIFSRREASSNSKPRTFSFYQSTEESPQWFTDSPSPTTSRRSMWSRKVKQAEKVRGGGTILHAVQTGHNTMSPLEIAMATSPNDEILQAAGRRSECNLSEPQSPFSTERGKGSESLSSSSRQSSFSTRIGVWRDGVATWEVPPEKLPNKTSLLENSKISHASERQARPHLSVIIPDSFIFSDRKVRQILGEEVSYANKPAYLQDDPVISRPTPSRRSTDPDESSIHPAFRNAGPFTVTQSRPERNRINSRSSVSSNTLSRDDTTDASSFYSRPSSMSSFDAGSPGEDKHDLHYLDILKRSGDFTFSIPSPVKAGIFEDNETEMSFPNVLRQDKDALMPTSLNIARPPSPTLSEAVHDLQKQLSVIVEEPLSRAPTIPPKSRKRQLLQTGPATQAARQPPSPKVSPRRGSAPNCLQGSSGSYKDGFRRTSSVYSGTMHHTGSGWKPLSVLKEPTALPDSPSTPKATSTSCTFLQEGPLCLAIMASSSTFEDLEAFSMINKAARKQYQQHRLRLVKNVMYNISPPAWELREWSPLPFGELASPDALAHLEITPAAYMSCVRHDQAVIEELKSLIVERCQSFIRPETVSGLRAKGTSSSTRFDNAFYRIWCFSKIFGCERGREHELQGQLDWLNGGSLAHERGCAATLSFQPELDLQGILLNAPDHFAQGNQEGLSAEQLYDMSEIWDCFVMLLQNYISGIEKAKSCGIFGPAPDLSMSDAQQQSILREWISYILTLGPSVVLELARFTPDCIDAGFDFANFNGWTDWIQPHQSVSRGNFFRLPVSQLYEEKLVALTAENESMKIGQRLLRKRQTEEIDLAHRGAPPVSYQREEPRCALRRTDSALAPEVQSPETPKARRPSFSRPTISGRHTPESPLRSPRRVSPIIESRVDTYNRLSMHGLDGLAEDTSERAIKKIVEIGFTTAQAKEALKTTDMGDGLRVDRAVDWLFRQT